jgi:hypothetical protein
VEGVARERAGGRRALSSRPSSGTAILGYAFQPSYFDAQALPLVGDGGSSHHLEFPGNLVVQPLHAIGFSEHRDQDHSAWRQVLRVSLQYPRWLVEVVETLVEDDGVESLAGNEGFGLRTNESSVCIGALRGFFQRYFRKIDAEIFSITAGFQYIEQCSFAAVHVQNGFILSGADHEVDQRGVVRVLLRELQHVAETVGVFLVPQALPRLHASIGPPVLDGGDDVAHSAKSLRRNYARRAERLRVARDKHRQECLCHTRRRTKVKPAWGGNRLTE